MKIDYLVIPSVILISGIFIFIKGFQSNLPLMEIMTIFLLFTGFLIIFSVICASIAVSIDRIITYLFNI